MTMTDQPISFTKALMDYFKDSRRITSPEFKELTHQDKVELREMLIQEGFNVAPLAEPKPIEA